MHAAKRVLIAGDEPALGSLLHIVAMRAGFQADIACDGVEALEKLRKNSHDVALIDLMMPRMSGHDSLEHLGSMDERPAVIVVTAMDDPQLAALDGLIVSSILHKPFDIEIVAVLLRETRRNGRRGERREPARAPPALLTGGTPRASARLLPPLDIPALAAYILYYSNES